MEAEPTEFRVFGPPGTGKTTYLSKQINRAAERYDGQVMVASFTRAAAVELAGRELKLPRFRVGTLHSFCYRSLGYPEIADTARWLKVYNESRKADHEQIHDAKTLDDPYGESRSSRRNGEDTTGTDLLGEYSRLRTQLIPEEDWPLPVRVFAYGIEAHHHKGWEHQGWEGFKQAHQLQDFTDLIINAMNYVEMPPFACNIGFFDEVQDFSPAELAVVRKWGRSFEKILIAGDDDQNLYSFRGAIPEAFLNPPIPEENIRNLKQSYRLPRQIKQLANEWIQGLSMRQPKQFEARDADGVVDYYINSTLRHHSEIVHEAWKEARAGRTVMILASCGAMLDPLIRSLRINGIPFWNPYRVTNGKWNPWRGGVDRLKAFLTDDEELYGNLTEPHTWGSVWRWLEVIDANRAGLSKGAKHYAKKFAADEKAKHTPLKPEDWKSLGLKDPRGDLDWLYENLLGSKKGLMSYAFMIATQRGIHLLRENPRIVIGTVHSVKGAQADTVFLFPDISYPAKLEAQSSQQGVDNLRRMFYVGMTRAKERLVLCSTNRLKDTVFGMCGKLPSLEEVEE